MERPFLHLLRVYVLAAMIVVFAILGAWAGWGSPSTGTLIWVAVVSVGLVIATALAVRDGAPTRSVAHILYDAEDQLGDARGNRPQGATGGATR